MGFTPYNRKMAEIMQEEPKKYQIDSWEKLLNVVNKDNFDGFIVDLANYLHFYVSSIEDVREKYPAETENVMNCEIMQSSFLWINDGKNDLNAVDIVNAKTGEIVRKEFEVVEG